QAYVDKDKEVADVKAALDGARQILMERFAEDADLLQQLRAYLWDNAIIESRVLEGKEKEGEKFGDYFEYEEALQRIPSHRALARLRGRNEGVLSLTMKLKGEEEMTTHPCVAKIAAYFN